MLYKIIKVISIMGIVALSACSTPKLIKPVDQVDLKRFMGDWYVIAAIPTLIERDPYNPIERYQLNSDGSIATTFEYNQGGETGPHKIYRPTGFVVPNSQNAVWAMQFVWPFKAEYIVAYLDEDYQTTIIARNKLDYVWLMARKPHMNEDEYQRMIERISKMGYDLSKLKRMPHAPA